MDRKALRVKLWAEMDVEPAEDGSFVVRLEGGVVGRSWQDPGTGHWKYEWCSRDGAFHAGVSELEEEDPNVAARWALTEIADTLAMRAQAMDKEFNA